MLEQNKIYLGDCLDLMKEIDDKSISAIICDLPYGVTNKNKWDIVIPFNKLWEQYERIIKDDGAIVLTSQQPFTSALIMSNPKLFRYELIWKKLSGKTGHLNAKKMPLREHENILVFYKKPCTYNPQMIGDEKRIIRRGKNKKEQMNYGDFGHISESEYIGYYPSSIIEFQVVNSTDRLHETEKPEKLYEWLIKTFSNEGDLILDNCCGSGTIGVAKTLGRNFIGIEKNEQYYNIAVNRINGFIYTD